MNTYFSHHDWCNNLEIRVAPEDWIVNGKSASKEDYYYLSKVIGEHSCSLCPYCENRLAPAEISAEGNGFNEYLKHDEYANSFLDHALFICRSCGFWKGSFSKSRGSFGMISHAFGAGVKRVFPINAPDPPMAEMTEYLRRRPELLTDINATVFEKFVGEIFRLNWGHVDVIHVGKTNDGGIDLILIVAEDVRWLVQCKRRQSLKATEGVRTVRELLGSLLAEGEMRGIVVSTADHFSFEAKKLAKKENLVDIGYQIELHDYGVLREMMTGNIEAPIVDAQICEPAYIPLEGPWASFFREQSRHQKE